jgi:hypothetical protein
MTIEIVGSEIEIVGSEHQKQRFYALCNDLARDYNSTLAMEINKLIQGKTNGEIMGTLTIIMAGVLHGYPVSVASQLAQAVAWTIVTGNAAPIPGRNEKPVKV